MLGDRELPRVRIGQGAQRPVLVLGVPELPFYVLVRLYGVIARVGQLIPHDVDLREHQVRLLRHDVILKIGGLPLKESHRATAKRYYGSSDGENDGPSRAIRDLFYLFVLLLVGVGLSAVAYLVLHRWHLRLLSVTVVLLIYAAVFVVLLHAVSCLGRLYEVFLG
jgi:NADH:ubiquinone oxidoreductase subunit 3 (subunit A)